MSVNEKSIKELNKPVQLDNNTYLMSMQWFQLGSICCCFMINMHDQYSRHSQKIGRLEPDFHRIQL